MKVIFKEATPVVLRYEADDDGDVFGLQHYPSTGDDLVHISNCDLIACLDNIVIVEDLAYLEQIKPELWPSSYADELRTIAREAFNATPNGYTDNLSQVPRTHHEIQENRERDIHQRAKKKHKCEKEMAKIEIFLLRYLLEIKKEELKSYA